MKNRRETGGVGRIEVWQGNNVRKFLTSINQVELSTSAVGLARRLVCA